MRQKSLILSILITLFVLGMAAGVARAAYSVQQPTPDESVLLKQTLSVRETQYRQSISEANTRLEQANQALQQMQEQLNAQETYIAQISTLQAAPPAAESNSSATSVSKEQARQTALSAANGWAELDGSSQPELVDYQGKAAFEVKLSDGGVSYVDAQDDSLLFTSLTGSAKSVISEDQAAKAAQTYLKGGGVFKVQRALYNNQPAYRVIFNVGHRIYVGLGGDILYVELHNLVAQSGGGGGGGGNSSAPAAPAPQHAEEHEDDDD